MLTHTRAWKNDEDIEIRLWPKTFILCTIYTYFSDCWDGPNGDPIVYHGWTLTSKLDLVEVLKDAIKPYAFYASEYPLILSFENHCSKKQQDRMAYHLKAVLGDLLCLESPDPNAQFLPSPFKLRRKILVKAKRQMVSEEDLVASEPQLHQLNEASSQLG